MEREAGVLNSKTMSSGKPCITFGVNKIDLSNLDAMLEKHMNRIFTKSTVARKPLESWQIDLVKLDLIYSVAIGGYGTVYRGSYDTQDVAVKVLDWGEDGVATASKIHALRADFYQEVAVWHKLDHPNVTKFIGASEGISNLKIPLSPLSKKSAPSKTCCIVSEFLPGGTLKQYLLNNKQHKIPYKVAIRLALDLSRGLSYLHSKRIVHRDVKTENMLLDANRNLKIADFGIACAEAANGDELTGESGTYGYMAPEVLKGKPYNRKCDVYSFGICLWEIYSCSSPYSALSLATVSCVSINQHLRPKIPKCCPRGLADIMRKCWDPKPERRPEMHEVVKMLEAIDTSNEGGMKPKNQKSSCFCFFPSPRL